MSVAVRGLYRGPDGDKVVGESLVGESMTDFMRAGGMLAELMHFVATLSKLAPVADQVDAAEAAKARDAAEAAKALDAAAAAAVVAAT